MKRRLRPRLVQFPRASHRAYHVVSTLHDDTGDLPDAVHISQYLTINFKKAAVYEVMAFDARKCDGKIVLACVSDVVRVLYQIAGAAFPHRPCARRGFTGVVVVACQSPVVGADQIPALHFGNGRNIVFPGVRKNMTGAFLVEPQQFGAAQHKDAAQYELRDTLRVCLGISDSEGATPGTAKHLPLGNVQVRTDGFHVRNQMPGCIVHEACVWRALSAPALVKRDDAVGFRIVVAPVCWRTAAARPAVHKNGRLAVGITAFFKGDFVYVRDLEPTDPVWL